MYSSVLRHLCHLFPSVLSSNRWEKKTNRELANSSFSRTGGGGGGDKRRLVAN